MKRRTLLTLALCGLLTACALGSPERAEQKSRLPVAEAMFAERCKKAGEFIHRTADNVEGIFLMKLRPEGVNRGDQYRMDDPYGRDVGGDGYIEIFLLGKDSRGSLVDRDEITKGYRFVETIDPKDGKRYRYTGSIKEVTKTSSPLVGGDGKAFKVKEFTLDRIPATGLMPRYGVTYDDLSTREERDYWIAGSSLKVIDLQSNEVMAERIGYMMDRGQGDISGGRSPWLFAARTACPAFSARPGGQPFKGYQTRNFVEKVLSIKQSDQGN